MASFKAHLRSLKRTPIDTAVADCASLTPVGRLFMDAGYSQSFYLLWRLSKLPSLKTRAALARLGSGWPIEAFDDEIEELRLAKRWLDGNSPHGAAEREKKAGGDQPEGGHCYGPLMTTTEAKALIQSESEAGSPLTLKAFEHALRRAAGKARVKPEVLPLALGGQHNDWELVALGPKSGGHGNGHRLHRQLLHTTGKGKPTLEERISQPTGRGHRSESSWHGNRSAAHGALRPVTTL